MAENLFKKPPNLKERLYWFPHKYETWPLCHPIRDIKSVHLK